MEKHGQGLILVVDDDENNRLVLTSMLAAEGYEVAEATDGGDALRAVAESPPDVVLLDVMMPGMDGLEACRRLKAAEETAAIPVLIVTALKDRASRLAGIEAGANDFLTKPVDGPELLLRVRNARQAKRLVDELRGKYDEVRELERQRDSLVHMIVHDLRNPLTVISMALQALEVQAGDSLGSGGRQTLGMIADSARALDRIIGTILDVSRFESGSMPLSRRPSDLRSLAEEAVRSVGSAARLQSLAVESPSEPVIADCDPNIIIRVIANLVANAVKFTPPGGSIRLTVGRREGAARVAVSDTGPGIPAGQHERIFEKFAQVDERQAGKGSSTGLGLTFCKLAVEAHGGRIGVQSREGEGSAFWFTLPDS